jgi:outer membrane lipopolysaccharide assembly protein LptE/RlpB
MKRALDATLLLLLVAALAQVGWQLTAGRSRTSVAAVPMLGSADAPGTLHAPGAPARAARAALATQGAVLTAEDLARGVLALERGELDGAPPLDAAARTQVAEGLRRVNEARESLLALETKMAAEDAALTADARALAATLTPEQRAWVLAARDSSSVADVERVYWDAVLAALPATTDTPPTATP